ncbi:MAG: hypothetical protein K2H04_10940 [Bacteroidaceae bacterium]|nr:hypothetical protein [Bacteroidaceae bacterium]MDE6000555.1 hypothetical protein [Bacteroidaceae bacterium]MDE6000566.1 hypothetical protein [Bacteroidaceae bacterium]
MKKIKRFVVNVLSPEEMRQVIVGGKQGCYTAQCVAYIYVGGELTGTYSGTCGEYDSKCVCKTKVGNYYDGSHACGSWQATM